MPIRRSAPAGARRPGAPPDPRRGCGAFHPPVPAAAVAGRELSAEENPLVTTIGTENDLEALPEDFIDLAHDAIAA